MTFAPPPLKKGGVIGIVSPARWPDPHWIAKGRAMLQKHGYRVIIHPQNYHKDGQLAGSDQERADALMDMFANPSVGAIMCARGGTGSLRLLDKIDYKLIKRNPKPFVGFSDITCLLQAIRKKIGMVTYHGPMMWNFAHAHHANMEPHLFAQIASTKKAKLKLPATCIRAGKAQGELVGGNISLLQLLMGTEYDWSAKNSILFIEDVDEALYKIDAKLCQMRLAGRFKNVRAVILGDMIDISDGETGRGDKGDRPYGRSLKQILLDNLPPDIPIAMDFPCGHGKYLTTLPIGEQVQISIGKAGVELALI